MGIIWYYFSQRNVAANALNPIIAIGELVPTVDLNLPPGIVLGAMIDQAEDVVEAWKKTHKY